jgi:hypothetical protein
MELPVGLRVDAGNDLSALRRPGRSGHIPSPIAEVAVNIG